MGLLVTGCAGEGPGSDDAAAWPASAATVLPQKLSEPPAMPKEEPSPADDATLSENLAYELRRKTLAMAKAAGEVTARCPKKVAPKNGTRVTCKTTYEGLEVVWDVNIGEKSVLSDNRVEYEAVPRRESSPATASRACSTATTATASTMPSATTSQRPCSCR
ncbi:hypothetical protein [Nonomuraea sp. B5E05]|uniref:hypothetical protein n=1 Tax=Nonomuraea sp. B5E05 TaxID=3153569 RepID=UPI00326163CE